MKFPSTAIKPQSLLFIVLVALNGCTTPRKSVQTSDFYPELQRQGNPMGLQKLRYGYLAPIPGRAANLCPSPNIYSPSQSRGKQVIK